MILVINLLHFKFLYRLYHIIPPVFHDQENGHFMTFLEFSTSWNGSSLILSGQIQPLQFVRNHQTEDLERSS